MDCVQLVLLTLILSTQGLPQASDKRTLFSEPMKDVPGAEKNYTGVRISKKSQLLIYYHEQTIAVVELGNERSLLNCELLEVKRKSQCQGLMLCEREIRDLEPTKVVCATDINLNFYFFGRTDKDRTTALNKLNFTKKKIRIGFKDMLDLMGKCQEIPAPVVAQNSQEGSQSQPYFTQQIFMGIFPGMKWCGRGDIAANYFDLGEEALPDKCCRAHDLCPVKVGGMVTQYNITNYSMVTRSHCACDEKFMRCLKNTKNSVSDLIGNLYFNIGQLSCVEEQLSENKIKLFTFKQKKVSY